LSLYLMLSTHARCVVTLTATPRGPFTHRVPTMGEIADFIPTSAFYFRMQQ